MKSRKIERRRRAMALLSERAGRTDKQQLARLDKMFGVEEGARKERARLTLREGIRRASL